MKTFFNVLYRKILYKIPLKFLLILLAVVAVFMACFSNALTLDNSSYPGQFELQIVNNFQGNRNIKQYYGYTYDGISCLFVADNNKCTLNDGTTTYSLNQNIAYCTDSNTLILNCSSSTYYYYYFFLGDEWLKEWYPDMTSLECQTEYSLIPISSVDQSYCVENNLCPASGGGDCPNVGVSNLFINDIFHPGAFNVIINIPEEIDWDYAYTNSGSNINIDVVGYNVDYTKVQDQIDIQNFKPSKEDLSSIITQVVPLFIPGLAIILLLYFIFRFIKKVF